MREIETLKKRVKELEAQLDARHVEPAATYEDESWSETGDSPSKLPTSAGNGIHLDTAQTAESSPSRAQFYGLSSTYYFIHCINSYLQVRDAPSPEVQSPQALIPNCASRSLAHAVWPEGAEQDVVVETEPVAHSAKASLEPRGRLSEHTLSGKNLTATQEAFFLDLFWDSWHCCYQLHDETEFKSYYKSLWIDTGNSSRQPSALVDIVLALCMQFGVTALPRQVESQAEIDIRDATIAGRWLYQRCQSLLAYELERPSLRTLQCQFWSAVYLANASYQNMAQNMIGVAVRTAHALGLHAEAPAELPLAEREARKRLWWTLFVFEARSCIRLGRPWGTQISQITCSLPAENQELYAKGVTWLSYTVQRTKLTQLVRGAFDKLSGRRTALNSREEYLEECCKVIDSSVNDIKTWVDLLPASLKIERRGNGLPFSTDLSELEIEPFAPLWLRRQRLMLEFQYHDLILTLGRFCIASSLISDPHDMGHNSSSVSPATLRIAESAALHAIAVTHQLSQIYMEHDVLDGWYEPFNYQWNAAITLVGFVLVHPRDNDVTPMACEALAKSIEVLGRMGSFFGVAASASAVINGLFHKATASPGETRGHGSIKIAEVARTQRDLITLPELDIGAVPYYVFPEAAGTFGPASELEGFGFDLDPHLSIDIGDSILDSTVNLELWGDSYSMHDNSSSN
ncbi:hypothetical protein NM208_g2859 [Fusarium decemcellulare]|uniref:Uncharacterized protein n=1 Tax=Fusarium decemcellulare TaxID=57161 RepID=A0ACC1SR94_9HYPO|nr:hypothetical protein NM208_g2859 [Fusarium decemcellulare]